VPHKSFPPEAILDWQSSSLIMSIQPDEGILLRFQAKQPGTRLLLKPVTMQFNYQESFSLPIPEAYETLLWDVMKNDATLFMRADQVEAAWQIIMPILNTWQKKHPVDFPNYAADTWGPQEADGFFKEGHHWPSLMELSEKK
jgi:glucose-6-phosphate 1-dehydrogenase